MEFRARLPEDGVNTPPSSPLIEVLVLVGGAAVAIVAIVAIGVLLLDAAIVRLPPDLEARWFAGTWEDLIAEDSSESAKGTRGYDGLRTVLARQSEAWDENPYEQLSVYIFDDEQENALALPGGTILVSSGLLAALGSENELAFIISHELGHFRNRDHLRRAGRGLLVALLWAGLGGNAAGSAPAVFKNVEELLSRRIDREAEREADRFGLALVMETYGHVKGASAFFERALFAPSEARAFIPAYVSTHPGLAERIDHLREVASDHGWPTEGPLSPWPPSE